MKALVWLLLVWPCGVGGGRGGRGDCPLSRRSVVSLLQSACSSVVCVKHCCMLGCVCEWVSRVLWVVHKTGKSALRKYTPLHLPCASGNFRTASSIFMHLSSFTVISEKAGEHLKRKMWVELLKSQRGNEKWWVVTIHPSTKNALPLQ